MFITHRQGKAPLTISSNGRRLPPMSNSKGFKIRPSRLVEGVLHYQCPRCNGWKPVGAFNPLPWQTIEQSRCKIRTICKKCETLDRRRYRRAGRPNPQGESPCSTTPLIPATTTGTAPTLQ